MRAVHQQRRAAQQGGVLPDASLEGHQQVGGAYMCKLHTKRYQFSISLEQSLARCEYEIDPLVSSGSVIPYVGSSWVCVYNQHPEITSAWLSCLITHVHVT